VDDVRVLTRFKRADPAYWEIFDFNFLEGGPYTVEDAREGRFVAVINATTGRRFFGAGPALGQSIRLDDQSFRVVGVVADVSPTRENSFAEAWAPIETIKSTTYRSALRHGFNGILLVRDRDAFPVIKAEYLRRIANAELTDPVRFDKLESWADTIAESIAREMTGNFDSEDPALGQLFGWIALGALLFMALPAINLVNLNLSRILERSSEIGVRKAFGASSLTLVAQFVVESVVLSLIGGLVGFILAGGCLNLLNRSELIPYADFSLNLRVFAAGLLLSAIFGVLSGVYPAWRMSRLHPVASIQGRVS
jgi:putative ABC transport system permease protein